MQSLPQKTIIEQKKEDFSQNQEGFSARIFIKKIEVQQDKEYSINQLNRIKQQLQTKEGIVYEQIEGKNELIMRCTKIASQGSIGLLPILLFKNPCTYKLIFKIINPSEFEDLIQNTAIEGDNINLIDKTFRLVKICDIHSENCPTRQRNFIFDRNLNLIKKNATFFQQLINKRYKQTSKPQTSKVHFESKKVYSQYISDFLGYNFMLHGYQGIAKLTQEEKQKKTLISRCFQNHVLQKARQKFTIPSFQTRKIKKIHKFKYSVVPHENQLKDQGDQQSPYTTSIRKKNRTFEKTMNLRPKRQKNKKLSSQFSQ